MKVSTPIIFVIAILASGYVFFFTGKKNDTGGGNTPISAPVDVSLVKAQAARKSEAKTRPPLKKIDVRWERDPFVLPKSFETRPVETTNAPMKLTAILSGEKGRVAVIGNEVVKKGDLIAGEKVFEIKSDGIVLTHGGSKRFLAIESTKKAIPEKSAGHEVKK